MANQKKKLQVDSLSKSITNSSHFALVNYGNTPHQKLENLRQELKASDAKLRVIKRSLFEKSVNKLAQQKRELKDFVKKVFPLRENSALLTLGEDYLKGLNVFAKAAKKEGSLAFKFGFLDKKLYPKEELDKIAQLPGRKQLLAKFIGFLRGSQSKLVYSMKFNVTKLTAILKERGKQN